MYQIAFAIRVLLVATLLQVISACTWLDETFPDRSKDYKTAKPTGSLEVPPDLTTTTATDALIVPDESTTLSGYTSAQKTVSSGTGVLVLPSQEDMTVQRDRDRTWLVVQGEPGAVWHRAREFWLENGFLIAREDPAVGILETDWTEYRAAIPKGPIRSLIGRVIDSVYSSAYQDRYRMRLEYGQAPGTTELFITHQGVEELVTDARDEGATKWVPAPNDPGKESEMLKRMMIYLGVKPVRAEQKLEEEQPAELRAELIQQDNGPATLVVHEGYSSAWRSVGIALDRVDFAVEDRDRSKGIYFVRYNDPLKGRDKEGFLSKLAFWSSDEEEEVERYQIKLTDDGADTRVVVLNDQGELDTSVTAVRILSLMYEQLQ